MPRLVFNRAKCRQLSEDAEIVRATKLSDTVTISNADRNTLTDHVVGRANSELGENSATINHHISHSCAVGA